MNHQDMIKKRTRQILVSTIESYIESGEVLGSDALLKKYQWDCSSATVRNDLKQLKDLGYLTQSHVSSGSVPTAKGYVHYLQELSEDSSVGTEQLNQFQKQMTKVSQDIDSVLMGMGRVLSQSLNYTVLVSMPSFWMQTIKALHMIVINMNSILILVLNSVGVSKDLLLSFTHEFTQEELNQFSKGLSDYLEGRTLAEFSKLDVLNLYQLLPQYRVVVDEFYKGIQSVQTDLGASSLNHFGVSNMLQLPECSNFEYMSKVLSLLERTQVLNQLLMTHINHNHVQWHIDDEQIDPRLGGCSLLIRPLKLAGKPIAQLGILGPTRMVYRKVLGLLDTAQTYLQSNRKE